MSRKVYVANSIFLSFPIQVGEEIRRIRFENGTTQPYRKNGTFSTTDAELQKALEDNGGFGKSYFLKEETESTTEIFKPNTESTEVIEGVSDYREAQKWLIDNKGIGYEEVNSKDKLVDKCKELGIVFKDYEF